MTGNYRCERTTTYPDQTPQCNKGDTFDPQGDVFVECPARRATGSSARPTVAPGPTLCLCSTPTRRPRVTVTTRVATSAWPVVNLDGWHRGRGEQEAADRRLRRYVHMDVSPAEHPAGRCRDDRGRSGGPTPVIDYCDNLEGVQWENYDCATGAVPVILEPAPAVVGTTVRRSPR